MRAEFYRPDAPDQVVGVAVWTGGDVRLASDDEETLTLLRRVFRKAPVTVDDASLRSFGTSGPVLLQPSGLPWFRVAARVRGRAKGLGVRIVPQGQGTMGWDPAGAYRTFSSAIERRERASTP